jgi:hypothetical protein
VPPADTWLPVIKTPTTIALLNPPGTTDEGTLDHDVVWDVAVGATLANELPEPELFDL